MSSLQRSNVSRFTNFEVRKPRNNTVTHANSLQQYQQISDDQLSLSQKENQPPLQQQQRSELYNRLEHPALQRSVSEVVTSDIPKPSSLSARLTSNNADYSYDPLADVRDQIGSPTKPKRRHTIGVALNADDDDNEHDEDDEPKVKRGVSDGDAAEVDEEDAVGLNDKYMLPTLWQHPPFDWSLPLRVKFFSSQPFDWAGNCNGQRWMKQQLAQNVSNQVGVTSHHNVCSRQAMQQGERAFAMHDYSKTQPLPATHLTNGAAAVNTLRRQAQLHSCLQRWQFPAEPMTLSSPMLQQYVKAQTKLQNSGSWLNPEEKQVRSYMHHRWQAWQAAFHSLYTNFVSVNNTELPYFYVMVPARDSYCILFVNDACDELSQDTLSPLRIRAVISKAGKEMRRKLRDEFGITGMSASSWKEPLGARDVDDEINDVKAEEVTANSSTPIRRSSSRLSQPDTAKLLTKRSSSSATKQLKTMSESKAAATTDLPPPLQRSASVLNKSISVPLKPDTATSNGVGASVSTPVVVHGLSNVQGLVEYITSLPYPKSKPIFHDVPILIAPTHFQDAVLKTASYSTSIQRKNFDSKDESGNIYTLQVDGLLLPSSLTRLYSNLHSAQQQQHQSQSQIVKTESMVKSPSAAKKRKQQSSNTDDHQFSALVTQERQAGDKLMVACNLHQHLAEMATANLNIIERLPALSSEGDTLTKIGVAACSSVYRSAAVHKELSSARLKDNSVGNRLDTTGVRRVVCNGDKWKIAFQ